MNEVAKGGLSPRRVVGAAGSSDLRAQQNGDAPDTPSEAELRATGYTIEALNHPLTEAEFLEKCRWNGADPSKVPATWRFAPNAWAKAYWAARVQSSESQGLR